MYVVNFFATPLINYSKLFETQSKVVSADSYGKNKKNRR